MLAASVELVGCFGIVEGLFVIEFAVIPAIVVAILVIVAAVLVVAIGVVQDGIEVNSGRIVRFG